MKAFLLTVIGRGDHGMASVERVASVERSVELNVLLMM
jgi:hypothetical protein